MTELLVLEIKTRSRSERLLWENQKDLMEGVLLWCSGLGIGSISGPGNSTFHKHGKKKKKKKKDLMKSVFKYPILPISKPQLESSFQNALSDQVPLSA